MKTIRQIADEIGVSKQAVFKKIKQEPLSTSLQRFISTAVDGRLMVEVDGEKLIKQAFEHKPKLAVGGNVDINFGDNHAEKIKKTVNQTKVDGGGSQPETMLFSMLQETVDMLTAQLEAKDRQLDAKDQQLAEKDRQIAEKDKQLDRQAKSIEDLAASLAAAQALHAGTLHQQIEGSSVSATQGQEFGASADDPENGEKGPEKKRGFFSRMFGG